MGALYYEWNDLPAARQHLLEGIELSRQWGNVDTLVSGAITLSRVLQALGDPAGALAALQAAGEALSGHQATPRTVARLEVSRARYWLRQGDLAPARRWRQQSRIDGQGEVGYLRLVDMSVARLLMAEGNNAPLRQQRLAIAAATGLIQYLIEILALQALTLQALGDSDQAKDVMERCLALAQPEGFIRAFVDEGLPMAELLRRMKAEGERPGPERSDGMKDYIDELLTAFADETKDESRCSIVRRSPIDAGRAAHRPRDRIAAPGSGRPVEPGDRRKAVHRRGHG
jgi:LuxR family maltose regulon positive regulatory protein